METEKTTKTTVEKITDQLTYSINRIKLEVGATLINGAQFERNCRNTFKVDIYEKNLEYINRWHSNIGKQVFKTVNTFTYNERCNVADVLNQTGLKSVLFTEELFHELLKNIVEYWIKYYSEDLLTRSITSNSSNKIVNLMFEWQLESKQELIKFYKELLVIINTK